MLKQQYQPTDFIKKFFTQPIKNQKLRKSLETVTNINLQLRMLREDFRTEHSPLMGNKDKYIDSFVTRSTLHSKNEKLL